jgi:hypothetical protein
MPRKFDMDLELKKARSRLDDLDAVDGGPGQGEMLLRTILVAFASGLAVSKCQDSALWDAYAMLEREVEVQCGHSFGTYGMGRPKP